MRRPGDLKPSPGSRQLERAVQWGGPGRGSAAGWPSGPPGRDPHGEGGLRRGTGRRRSRPPPSRQPRPPPPPHSWGRGGPGGPGGGGGVDVKQMAGQAGPRPGGGAGSGEGSARLGMRARKPRAAPHSPLSAATALPPDAASLGPTAPGAPTAGGRWPPLQPPARRLPPAPEHPHTPAPRPRAEMPLTSQWPLTGRPGPPTPAPPPASGPRPWSSVRGPGPRFPAPHKSCLRPAHTGFPSRLLGHPHPTREGPHPPEAGARPCPVPAPGPLGAQAPRRPAPCPPSSHPRPLFLRRQSVLPTSLRPPRLPRRREEAAAGLSASLPPGPGHTRLPGPWHMPCHGLGMRFPSFYGPPNPAQGSFFSRCEISDPVCLPSLRPLPSALLSPGVSSDAPSWPGARARPGAEPASGRAARGARAFRAGQSPAPPPLSRPRASPPAPSPSPAGSYPGARHTLRPRGLSSWGAVGPGSSQSSSSSSDGPPAPRRRAGPAPRGPAPSMRRGAGAGRARARVRPLRERPEAECTAGRGAAGGAPGRAGNSTSAP